MTRKSPVDSDQFDPGLRRGRGLAVVDERLGESRRARPGQDAAHDLQREVIVVGGADRRPPEVQSRDLDAIFVDEPLFTRQGRRRHDRSRDLTAARQVGEILRDIRLGLRRLKVADDRDRRVRRRVILAEEVLHVIDRRLLELGQIADHRPGIGIRLRIHRRRGDLEGAAVGLIVRALAALVLDDVALRRELRRVELVEQEAHAIGLDPEHALEIVRRNGLVVVRAVVARRAVVGNAAHAFGEAVVQPVRYMRRAREHHVLEHVGEPRVPRHLVLGADMVPDVDGDLGNGVVRSEDDVEPIRQRHALQRNVDRGRLAHRRQRREEGERDDEWKAANRWRCHTAGVGCEVNQFWRRGSRYDRQEQLRKRCSEIWLSARLLAVGYQSPKR